MDIVDINKVLDDLELNEEEQYSKLSKPAAHNDAENRLNKQQQLYGPTSAGAITAPSNTMAAGIPAVATMPSVSNRMPKTNFVKVSNVFNR